jgi:hypothetical protein
MSTENATPAPAAAPDKKPEPAPQDDVQALKGELEALRREKANWSSNQEGLNDKVRREREDQDRKNADHKNLESALTFNLTSQTFLKSNESVLPKDIGEIFKAAEKESYSSAIEKANATKSAIIQNFFSQQSNVDYLTDSQKSTLADYLKLTKNGKEEKASQIYDNLFEPALSTLKRVKKAEEVAKASQGYGGNTDMDQAYKARLMEMANKKYFGGKK